MHREYHKWYSPTLGRDMELSLFGHAGARVIIFPTSQGRHFEWPDRGLPQMLGEHLERGWLQVFCVDSIDADSWYAYHLHPGQRAWHHELYDRYLCYEVLPFTWSKNPTPFVITVGASFGGYHALNFGMRHPDVVRRILCFSGLTDIRHFVPDFHNDTVYFNNPIEFVPNEHEPHRLAALRTQDIILAIGRDDRFYEANKAFSQMLWDKNIWHAFRCWDGWSHDWPYWEKMIRLYIGGHD